MTDSYETVTNTIGWFPDRNYMIALDAKIKSLIPYYADMNTVYDGTTNIVMLTVTGLWASLGIGDKTNKFTREPAWTNPISTNWIVNYTSYWPSTNGMTTNICYTSDCRQVVNYAYAWSNTLTTNYFYNTNNVLTNTTISTNWYHVWTNGSNWASEVVQITNAATYGDYPWQIYVEDLQERYKVLNALKIIGRTKESGAYSYVGNYNSFSSGSQSNLESAKEIAEGGFLTNSVIYTNQNIDMVLWYGKDRAYYSEDSSIALINIYRTEITKIKYNYSIETSVLHKVSYYYRPFTNLVEFGYGVSHAPLEWGDNGSELDGTYSWHLLLPEEEWNNSAFSEVNCSIGLSKGTIPSEVDSPSLGDGYLVLYDPYGYGWLGNWNKIKGMKFSGNQMTIDWNFQYCTNKFW
jgi:hypothetical protein